MIKDYIELDLQKLFKLYDNNFLKIEISNENKSINPLLNKNGEWIELIKEGEYFYFISFYQCEITRENKITNLDKDIELKFKISNSNLNSLRFIIDIENDLKFIKDLKDILEIEF